MYGIKWALTSQSGGEAITSATTITVAQVVAQSARNALITNIAFDLETSVACEVIVQKQSSAGTMTANNPVSYGPGAPTLLTTGQRTATAEPTSSAVIMRRWTNSGKDILLTPDEGIELAGGERLGLTFITEAAVTVHYTILGRE